MNQICRTDEQRRSRRPIARSVPDLLGVLSDRLLLTVAGQCGISETKHLTRERLVEEILGWRRAHPHEHLYLARGSLRPQKPLSPGRAYCIGGLGSALAMVPVAGPSLPTNSSLSRWLEIREDIEILGDVSIVPDLTLITGCTHLLVLESIVIDSGDNDFQIPFRSVLLTDRPKLEFRSRLVMETETAILGSHECGLEIVCNELATDIGRRHLFSTRVVRRGGATKDASQLQAGLWALPAGTQPTFELDDSTAGAFALPNIAPFSLFVHGEKGGPKLGTPARVVGAHGKDLGGDPSTPQDGESVGDGTAGANGRFGEDGVSTGPLKLRVQNWLELGLVASGPPSRLYMVTSAGCGGDGQPGQDGGWVNGGDGESAEWWMGQLAKPGNGGSVGSGGAGGAGGDGGGGGNAGFIVVDVHPEDFRDRVICYSRGGSGGESGKGGAGGRSFAGSVGAGADPFGVNAALFGSAFDGEKGPDGVVGADGLPGLNGMNGSIFVRVNGTLEQTVVSTVSDSSLQWSARGSQPLVVVSPVERCWAAEEAEG